MKLFHLFKMKLPQKYQVKYGLEILGIEVEEEYQETVLNEISLYLFDNSKTEQNGKKVFDFELDYEYYWVDFLEKGINLNKDEISWWEFDKILGGLFLQEHSKIGKVIQYRTYKKPTKNNKVAESEEHKFYLEKQRQYALPLEENNDVDKSIDNLWNFLSSKTGKE